MWFTSIFQSVAHLLVNVFRRENIFNFDKVQILTFFLLWIVNLLF